MRARREIQAHGYKATPQRLTILRALQGRDGYLTPQELYRRLRARHPTLGLTTVYRALRLLTAAGLVCQIDSPGQPCRYGRRPLRHHHHLVCSGCARVVDFDHCALQRLGEKLARETGFTISGHNLEFYGLCAACRAAGRTP